MHEMALALSIVDIIRERAAEDGFRRVLKVHLCVGALATVDPDALAFGFSVASRDTVSEGAELVIGRPAGKAFCGSCGTTFEATRRSDPCPACERVQWILLDGDQMRVTELEVE